jgi:hypothetical protein
VPFEVCAEAANEVKTAIARSVKILLIKKVLSNKAIKLHQQNLTSMPKRRIKITLSEQHLKMKLPCSSLI